MGALHVLGRGTYFDVVSELSFMSVSIAAATFHRFCECFAQEIFHVHVRLPTGEAQKKVIQEYHALGFTGAIGSTDVTRVRWDACPS